MEPNSNSSSKQLASVVIGASFLGTIGIISPFILMQIKSPLPYMATPRRKIISALQFINQQRQRYDGSVHPRYYDLGSGDGETVLAAASLNWKATGFELNSTLYMMSMFRRLMIRSNTTRNNSSFIYGDMWKQSIHNADAVMIFGVKPLMPKIANKIQSECKPGTFVLSYRFLIPIIDSSSTKVSVNLGLRNCDVNHNKPLSGVLNADLVYDEEEMRVYQLRS